MRQAIIREFPAPAPTDRRAAFLHPTVNISTGQSWPDVIYVANSKYLRIEDGTHTHPYSTIQKGINNNPSNKEVWVDDSGTPYTENVQLINGAVVKSVNWDTTSGTNRATIEGPGDNSVELASTRRRHSRGIQIVPSNPSGGTIGDGPDQQRFG